MHCEGLVGPGNAWAYEMSFWMNGCLPDQNGGTQSDGVDEWMDGWVQLPHDCMQFTSVIYYNTYETRDRYLTTHVNPQHTDNFTIQNRSEANEL